jgi:hypothetical protein
MNCLRRIDHASKTLYGQRIAVRVAWERVASRWGANFLRPFLQRGRHPEFSGVWRKPAGIGNQQAVSLPGSHLSDAGVLFIETGDERGFSKADQSSMQTRLGR